MLKQLKQLRHKKRMISKGKTQQTPERVPLNHYAGKDKLMNPEGGKYIYCLGLINKMFNICDISWCDKKEHRDDPKAYIDIDDVGVKLFISHYDAQHYEGKLFNEYLFKFTG